MIGVVEKVEVYIFLLFFCHFSLSISLSKSFRMTLFAVADFCLIPMGTPSPSVGIYIAECQKVLESMKEEGIKYEMQYVLCFAINTTLDLYSQYSTLLFFSHLIWYNSADMEPISKVLFPSFLVR